MKRRSRILGALTATLVAVALVSPVASIAATVTIVNIDGPSEGFNDPTPVLPVGGNTGTTLGEQRLIALQYAADQWGATLDSDQEILVEASFDPLPCSDFSAVLGGAAAVTVHRDFAGAPVPGTFYPAALANKLAGVDLDPANNDMFTIFNSLIDQGCTLVGLSWYYGLDASPPVSLQIDLVTVMLHELAHGLGFQTFVNLATGQKFMGADDTFMRNLEDHSTGLTYPQMTNAERVAASVDTGDLHWVGQAVVLGGTDLVAGTDANGHVEMYAPNPARPGSSVSHFSTSLSPAALMAPAIVGANHDITRARELLLDIGWGGEFLVCDLETDQALYSGSEPVSITRFRLANLGSVAQTVELKVWLELPGSDPVSIVNIGADGSFVMDAGLDADLAPITLFNADAVAVGQYLLGCRALDDVTGELLVEDEAPFQIQ